ncbi:MAG: hypothetical protein GQ534_00750, partial [Candidatus Delongbacteria bacterium]|nr:hypothetical protein [Candidatus Delongbacteria bacterium]
MKIEIISLNDDLLNRKDIKFSIETLESSLHQIWKEGIPSCISHDLKRPFAWIKGMGLLLEPDICTLIGQINKPECVEDIEEIKKKHEEYIGQIHFNLSEEKLQIVIDKVSIELTEEAKFCNFGFDGVIDKNIVLRKFPKLFNSQDKKGLISLKNLNYYAPGVFEIGELIIFAHHYFRRSLSRLNNYNDDFLTKLYEISKVNSEVKIALDLDLIGLKSTYKNPLEFEYWWGPKFDNDISKINSGVTCHEAEGNLKFFHGIERTEFFWYEQDGKYALECEEISNQKLDQHDFNYGCRYVHSMVDKESKLPIHLDGAIRGYSSGDILKRLEIDISKQGRNLSYQKLWRVDGEIKILEWKELICHFYRDNTLPGEYLHPIVNDEITSDLNRSQNVNIENVNEELFDINQGDGVRCFVSYKEKDEYENFTNKFNLIVNDLVNVDNKTTFYVENCFCELEKLFRLENKKISYKQDYSIYTFEDTVDNYPLIYHSGDKA